MKTKIIAVALLAFATGCIEREHKIIKVESTECVMQCAQSFWKASFDEQKYAACKELFAKAPCCVYEMTNSCSGLSCPGEPWTKGQRGRVVACEVKP